MATAFRLLRLSNYLSGFVLGNRIDYSALQVVVRWINEVLKAAPPGFEDIALFVEKLDGFVRLSSGWGFYDIWNAFLTNVTPPTDVEPLEVLGKVSSFTAGKEIFLDIQIRHCLSCSDLRSQAFQFAALCTLPAVLSNREIEIVRDLKKKFQQVCFI